MRHECCREPQRTHSEIRSQCLIAPVAMLSKSVAYADDLPPYPSRSALALMDVLQF